MKNTLPFPNLVQKKFRGIQNSFFRSIFDECVSQISGFAKNRTSHDDEHLHPVTGSMIPTKYCFLEDWSSTSHDKRFFVFWMKCFRI